LAVPATFEIFTFQNFQNIKTSDNHFDDSNRSRVGVGAGAHSHHASGRGRPTPGSRPPIATLKNKSDQPSHNSRIPSCQAMIRNCRTRRLDITRGSVSAAHHPLTACGSVKDGGQQPSLKKRFFHICIIIIPPGTGAVALLLLQVIRRRLVTYGTNVTKTFSTPTIYYIQTTRSCSMPAPTSHLVYSGR